MLLILPGSLPSALRALVTLAFGGAFPYYSV
jgi:hypothetical protein